MVPTMMKPAFSLPSCLYTVLQHDFGAESEKGTHMPYSVLLGLPGLGSGDIH